MITAIQCAHNSRSTQLRKETDDPMDLSDEVDEDDSDEESSEYIPYNKFISKYYKKKADPRPAMPISSRKITIRYEQSSDSIPRRTERDKLFISDDMFLTMFCY